MPLQIIVDDEDMLNCLDKIQSQIMGIERALPKEFYAWQVEDMKRKFPEYSWSGWSIQTSVFPRSRRDRVRVPRKGGSGSNSNMRPRLRRRSGPKRPILRPMLVDKLMERMVEMCRKSLTREPQ